MDMSYREVVISNAHHEAEGTSYSPFAGGTDALYSERYGGRDVGKGPSEHATSPFEGAPGVSDPRCAYAPTNLDAYDMRKRADEMCHLRGEVDNHTARFTRGVVVTPSVGNGDFSPRIK